MSEQFHVGQLVVLQHANYFIEYEGAPAVVVGGLVRRRAMNMLTMKREEAYYYLVEALSHPPMQFSAEPHQMRPLESDSDTHEMNRDKTKELVKS